MKFTKLAVYVSLMLMAGLSACLKTNNRDEEMIIENQKAIENYIAADSMGNQALRDSSGFYYIIRKSNPAGKLPVTGDGVTIKLSGFLMNGGKQVITRKDDEPFEMIARGFVTDLFGLELGILKMRVGEKATILAPYYLAFGNANYGQIPAYSVLRFEVEMLRSKTEAEQIDDFLAARQFPVTERYADGLVIIRTNTVTGDTLGTAKSVSVKYVGKFLNNTKFDEGTFSLTTGTGKVVSGFDSAVRKMRKTEKAIIVFPSSLGYKETGSGSIPPYAPLQFEIEVL